MSHISPFKHYASLESGGAVAPLRTVTAPVRFPWFDREDYHKEFYALPTNKQAAFANAIISIVGGKSLMKYVAKCHEATFLPAGEWAQKHHTIKEHAPKYSTRFVVIETWVARKAWPHNRKLIRNTVDPDDPIAVLRARIKADMAQLRRLRALQENRPDIHPAHNAGITVDNYKSGRALTAAQRKAIVAEAHATGNADRIALANHIAASAPAYGPPKGKRRATHVDAPTVDRA